MWSDGTEMQQNQDKNQETCTDERQPGGFGSHMSKGFRVERALSRSAFIRSRCSETQRKKNGRVTKELLEAPPVQIGDWS
jgi:hypothetical protein